MWEDMGASTSHTMHIQSQSTQEPMSHWEARILESTVHRRPRYNLLHSHKVHKKKRFYLNINQYNFEDLSHIKSHSNYKQVQIHIR